MVTGDCLWGVSMLDRTLDFRLRAWFILFRGPSPPDPELLPTHAARLLPRSLYGGSVDSLALNDPVDATE